MSELAVIEHGAELGASPVGSWEIANREHELAEEAGLSIFEHMIRSGEELLVLKARTPTGEWSARLVQEFRGSSPTANIYMRIATYQGVLRELGITSRGAAIRKLGELELACPMGPSGTPKSVRREALSVWKAGRTQVEVAELYGVSRSTITRWVNPEAERARQRRKVERKRLAVTALLREQQAKAFRKAGGNIGKAHEHGLLYAEALGRAISEEGNHEAREELNSALQKFYRSEDHLKRALPLHDSLAADKAA